MSNLVTQQQLSEWTGYARAADIERWLRENKIPFTFGKGNKLCTTQTAIDRAILGESHNAKAIEF